MNPNRTRALAALAVAAVATGVLQVISAGAALAVPDRQFVSALSANDSVATKSATATCPEGTRIFGGGGYISGGDRRVQLTRLQPNGNSNTFVASATEIGDYAGNWRISAYGVCGEAPAGLEYNSFHSASNSNASKMGTAPCSFGKRALGAGARTEGGDGQAIIEDIYVPGTLQSVTVTTLEDSTGYSGNWSMWAYSVCADPVPGLERRSDLSVIDSEDKAVAVSCSAGKEMYGVAGRINIGEGEVMHRAIYPTLDLSGAGVLSIEEANGRADDWSSEVFAICGF